MQGSMLDTIYRKASMNGTVTPMEVVLLVRDIHRRLLSIEEMMSELERPTTDRQESSKASKRKVSSDGVSDGPDK